MINKKKFFEEYDKSMDETAKVAKKDIRIFIEHLEKTGGTIFDIIIENRWTFHIKAYFNNDKSIIHKYTLDLSYNCLPREFPTFRSPSVKMTKTKSKKKSSKKK